MHGIRHADVGETLRSFLNFADLPVRIMTGHSSKMKEIVESVATEYEWNCRESIDNSGVLIIEELC